jgi:hypothetical protein
MKIINQTIRCSECGCIAFLDSVNCPNCGAHYRNKEINMAEAFKYEPLISKSNQGITSENQSIIEAYCDFICSHYTQINIRTTVIIPR